MRLKLFTAYFGAGLALLLAGSRSSGQAPVEPAPALAAPIRGVSFDGNFPDPFVMRHGTAFFAFATNSGGSNVQVATSPDLIRWSALPDALPHLPAWATRGHTWAPEVLALGPQHFVLYYTVRDKKTGFQCLSRALATHPAGPYADSSAGAFVCQIHGQNLCGSIDPSPFVDADGRAYLLWKSDENAPPCFRAPRLWSAPLSADGLALAGPPRPLLAMDRAWQRPIIEAPSMALNDGKYYLLYSANGYESASYAMGYATCASPLGPCQNVSTHAPAIASMGRALGPGGGSLFEDAGQHWLAYHAWSAPRTSYASGGVRSLRIDRVSFEGGVISLRPAHPDGDTVAALTPPR